MQTIELEGQSSTDNDGIRVVLPVPSPATRVAINLNEDVIIQQLRKAKLPMFAKKMARRILTLCLQKDSGTLWINQVALRSLRKSALIGDAYDALNRLQQRGIIEWRKETRNKQDVAVVRFVEWV